MRQRQGFISLEYELHNKQGQWYQNMYPVIQLTLSQHTSLIVYALEVNKNDNKATRQVNIAGKDGYEHCLCFVTKTYSYSSP